MVRHFIAALIAIAVFPLPARANEADARAALRTALDRAECDARTSPRLSFTETVAEKGVKVAAHYHPVGATSGQWTPVGEVAPGGQERSSYREIIHDTPNERDLLLDRVRASLGDLGRLVSETADEAKFDFALSPQAHPTNSLLDGALHLSEHVRVELAINKIDPALTRMRFYAPTAFAATPLAHVDRLNLSFSFGPSYAGGPIVVRRINSDAAYRVTGFNNQMRDTVWFDDIAPNTHRAPDSLRTRFVCRLDGAALGHIADKLSHRLDRRVRALSLTAQQGAPSSARQQRNVKDCEGGHCARARRQEQRPPLRVELIFVRAQPAEAVKRLPP